MLGYARAITALVPAQLWSVRIIREFGQTGDRILEIGISDMGRGKFEILSGSFQILRASIRAWTVKISKRPCSISMKV